MQLPLSSHESLCPLGDLIYLDFVFYDVKSTSGCTSALDFTCLSARYPFSFLHRSKRPPLAVLQCLLNMLKAKDRTVRRNRSDEDGSLAKSYEFNMLLINNDIQLNTTGAHGSKLNNHWETKQGILFKKRIGLGLQSLFPKSYWCLAREYAAFIKSRT